MLRRGGFEPIETRTFAYDNPPEAHLPWLQVPIFIQNVLPGMPYETQLAVLAKAYDRLDKSLGHKSQGMAFVARKP